MDLQLKDRHFLVCGATSGFGLAIAQRLLNEGASITAVARTMENLQALYKHQNRAAYIAMDVTAPGNVQKLLDELKEKVPDGVLVNAGGPPPKHTLETTLDDWDNAYHSLLRWKVDLTTKLVPEMVKAGYGRLLYIESSSVKQPLESLVLSNSLRVAVVNMMKTLSSEIAHTGVTLNAIAPGSHDTPRIQNLYRAQSERSGLPVETIRQQAISQIGVQALGDAGDLASLACWLLSPLSRFVTGQTFSVDGGTVKGIFG